MEFNPMRDIMALQNHACAICRMGEGKAGGLRMDRDDNGMIRGFLCADCRIGVGSLQRNPTLIRIAANYLQETLV